MTRARSTHSSAASGRLTAGAGRSGGGAAAAWPRSGAAGLTAGGRSRIICAVSAASDAGETGAGFPTRSATASTTPIVNVVAANRSQFVRAIAPSTCSRLGRAQPLEIAREPLAAFEAFDEDDVRREEALIVLHVVAGLLVEAHEVGQRAERRLVGRTVRLRSASGLAQLSQTRLETRDEVTGALYPEVGSLARRDVRGLRGSKIRERHLQRSDLALDGGDRRAVARDRPTQQKIQNERADDEENREKGEQTEVSFPPVLLHWSLL